MVLVAQLPDLRRAVTGIGELLLNRELASIIGHLKSRGVYVVFNTAALLTKRRQEELIDSGLDELRVSIDGSTPDTYLQVRGIPVFDRVVANVAQMVATKRECGVSSPRLSSWMTGMRENLAELPDLVDLAARIWSGRGVPAADGVRLRGHALARADQTIYQGGNAAAESIIAEAERRAAIQSVSLGGADGLSPRESILERRADREPWARV